MAIICACGKNLPPQSSCGDLFTWHGVNVQQKQNMLSLNPREANTGLDKGEESRREEEKMNVRSDKVAMIRTCCVFVVQRFVQQSSLRKGQRLSAGKSFMSVHNGHGLFLVRQTKPKRNNRMYVNGNSSMSSFSLQGVIIGTPSSASPRPTTRKSSVTIRRRWPGSWPCVALASST